MKITFFLILLFLIKIIIIIYLPIFLEKIAIYSKNLKIFMNLSDFPAIGLKVLIVYYLYGKIYENADKGLRDSYMDDYVHCLSISAVWSILMDNQ